MLVDGATEYTKYDYQIVSDAIAMGDPDEAVFFPLMQTMPRMLPAGQSFSGDPARGRLRRGLAGHRCARTLAGRRPGSPTFAGVLINDSDVNPVGMNLVPPNVVVPALVEINVILQTDVGA